MHSASGSRAVADIGIRDGVQVNAINPGRVKTDRLKQMMAAEAAELGGDVNTAEQSIIRKSNIVRLGEPEDVANRVIFLPL